ncbi:YncE family protein [Deinococcus cellulosilyticus]|nr:hypothetical protein [Deinococcus cellulosilyticus]
MTVFKMLLLGVSLLGGASARDLYASLQTVPAPVAGSSCMLDFEACIASDTVGNQLFFVPGVNENRAVYAFDAVTGKTRQVMPLSFPVCDLKFINDHQFYLRGLDLTLHDLKDLTHPLKAQLPRGYVNSCEDDMLSLSPGINKVVFTSTQGDIMHSEIGKAEAVLDLKGNDSFNEMGSVDGNNVYFIDDHYSVVKLDLNTRKTQKIAENEYLPRALMADPATHRVYFSSSKPKLCQLNIYDPASKKLQTLQVEVCATVIKKTPQGEILLAGRFGGILVLDAQGKVLQRMKEQKNISSVEFLQDGTLCVILEDSSLHLYRRNS